MTPLPRRRSCLTVPGASEKMLAKALSVPADEIVLDLEDAVPPAHKAEARQRIAALLASDAWRERTVSVRINAHGSAWWQEDITAIAASGHPRLTLVVPKAEKAADLTGVETMLALSETRAAHVGLQALIETAAGIANLATVAGATGRLQALIVGYADLASSLGRPAGSTASWQTVQDLVLIAARAHGLQAIDGPFFRLNAEAELIAECHRGQAQGFDGKWAIHPAQVETINAVFTPGTEEIAGARALLSRLQQTGGGAASLDGGMVDEAMRAGALRTLARAGLAE